MKKTNNFSLLEGEIAPDWILLPKLLELEKPLVKNTF